MAFESNRSSSALYGYEGPGLRAQFEADLEASTDPNRLVPSPSSSRSRLLTYWALSPVPWALETENL